MDASALELGRVLELRGDLPRAEAVYRLAGESGDARAFYALGRVLHSRGAPEYQISAAWRYAADAGVADAMYALAVLDADGGGEGQGAICARRPRCDMRLPATRSGIAPSRTAGMAKRSSGGPRRPNSASG